MTDFTPENMTVANGPKPFAPRADDFGMGSGRPPASNQQTGAPSQSDTGTTSTQTTTPETPATPSATPATPATAAPAHAQAPTTTAPEVKGRIEVADEVVEKVAGLACMEVEGVADLGGDIERALESVRDRIGIGNKRGDQGIKAKINGREVSIDVTIMIEYGHVVMEVARNVKNNVASQTSRMLGLKVVEVNVTVDDVKLPTPAKKEEEVDDDGLVTIEG
ncbi:MAG TPA: Asp23/Gls24 family envelope stress response protein [Acidimicrobiales bacterium]|nr:Asp23/Gls24 family envelope stress response protein [Acidimicrobiales bacterium]